MMLTEDSDGIRLKVHVQPRARKDLVRVVEGDELKIQVTSPPVKGAANRALKKLLGSTFDIPPSRVEILSGHTSRHKTIRIVGLTLDRAQTLLDQFVES
jgi:uncharacterized protein (TIGR00251 family)